MVRLILRIFHTPNKLVGVVKCTELSGRVMTKRMSYTDGFKRNTDGFKHKTVELAEATSNRNAGKELGINEKLVRDRS